MRYIVPLIISILILTPRVSAQQQAIGILPLIRVGMASTGLPDSAENSTDTMAIAQNPESMIDSSLKVRVEENPGPLIKRLSKTGISGEKIIKAIFITVRPGKSDPVGVILHFVVQKALRYEYRER